MRLSKSRLVAYRQCPKRLWLQTFRRELAQQSEASANRIAQGNLVGAAAQRLYPEGRLIAHVADLGAALRETTEALAEPGDITLFEPALRCADVLVRADVLIRRDGRYRMIEVKSSTKVRDSHVTDTAIQTWVARGAGLDIERVELAHIDNTFVYAGDGDYRGLFAHADMTDAVLPLQEQIPVWIAAAQNDLAGPMPDIATGPQCRKPFECEFLAFCQPETAEYPVELLPNSTRLARQLRGDGFADLRDVPLDRLKREDHQRIWRATVAGQPLPRRRRRREARCPPVAALLPRLRDCRPGRADVARHAPISKGTDAVVVPPAGCRRHAHPIAAVPRHHGPRSTPRVRGAACCGDRHHRSHHGLQRDVRARRDDAARGNVR